MLEALERELVIAKQHEAAELDETGGKAKLKMSLPNHQIRTKFIKAHSAPLHRMKMIPEVNGAET